MHVHHSSTSAPSMSFGQLVVRGDTGRSEFRHDFLTTVSFL